MKDYIVSLRFGFSAVTGCIAKNESEALRKVINQVDKDKVLKALSTIKLNKGKKDEDTFNDLCDFEVEEDYTEEG